MAAASAAALTASSFTTAASSFTTAASSFTTATIATVVSFTTATARRLSSLQPACRLQNTGPVGLLVDVGLCMCSRLIEGTPAVFRHVIDVSRRVVSRLGGFVLWTL